MKNSLEKKKKQEKKKEIAYVTQHWVKTPGFWPACASNPVRGATPELCALDAPAYHKHTKLSLLENGTPVLPWGLALGTSAEEPSLWAFCLPIHIVMATGTLPQVTGPGLWNSSGRSPRPGSCRCWRRTLTPSEGDEWPQNLEERPAVNLSTFPLTKHGCPGSLPNEVFFSQTCGESICCFFSVPVYSSGGNWWQCGVGAGLFVRLKPLHFFLTPTCMWA